MFNTASIGDTRNPVVDEEVDGGMSDNDALRDDF